MRELYKKAVVGDNLLEKAFALLSVLIKNTETNLTMKDSATYAQYIPKISGDNLGIFILPGKSERINSLYYFVANQEEFESYVADNFR